MASRTAANGKDNGKREPFQRERRIFQSLFFRGHVSFLGEDHLRIHRKAVAPETWWTSRKFFFGVQLYIPTGNLPKDMTHPPNTLPETNMAPENRPPQ